MIWGHEIMPHFDLVLSSPRQSKAMPSLLRTRPQFINLPLHPSITPEQNAQILKLIHLKQTGSFMSCKMLSSLYSCLATVNSVICQMTLSTCWLCKNYFFKHQNEGLWRIKNDIIICIFGITALQVSSYLLGLRLIWLLICADSSV